MPVDVLYVKILEMIYPNHPRGRPISWRCDLAMKIGQKLSYLVHFEMKHLNTTDFAILLDEGSPCRLLPTRW